MMKRVFVVLFALLLFGVIAGPAWADTPAQTDPPVKGYIEFCKAPNEALNGTFGITFTKGSQTYSVLGGLAQGTCSRPYEVDPGSWTVTETGSSLGMNDDGNTVADSREFLNEPTSTVVGKGDAPGANLATGWTRTGPTAVIVPAGNVSDVVKVTFSNTLKTGVIEVCKSVLDPTHSPLTGSWSFHVTGGNQFATDVSTTVGNCSGPITLPAGHFKVVETGIQSVTAITASQDPGPAASNNEQMTSYDLDAATIVAMVDPGNASEQTIVTFTNNLVTFKLCKAWEGDITDAAASYTFDLAYSGVGAPVSGPSPVSLAPGTCKDLGNYRAGTRVVVTERVTPGQKVDWIWASQGLVPDTLSRPNRTVTVDLMAGETVVKFVDTPADPGWVKICKATTAGETHIPAGTVFTFTVAALTGYPAGTSDTVTVTAGDPGTTQCSAPIESKFNATWKVTESARAGTTVSAITAVPSKVIVEDKIGDVATNQDVLTAVDLPNRSANVTTSEGKTTEVTFTNVDPPSVPIVVVSSGDSSSPVVITPVAGLPVLTPVAPAAPFVPPVVSASKSASASAAVQVSQLKKQLATLKTTQAKLQKAFLHAKTKAAKNALAKRIGIVKAQQKQIIHKLQLLS
jgi:hypothetical protein